MHVAYAFQEGENVTNWDHPRLTPRPFPLHFSGPLVAGAALAGPHKATVRFTHGEGLFLNDTMGCEIHRGVDFAGDPIGGECCGARDTFQLCAGVVANTSALTCVNATAATLGEGEVTLGWAASAAQRLGGDPTSVRYAYANFPQCAMFNKYALPAGPFVAELQAAAPAAPAVGAAPAAAAAGVCTTPPMGVNSWNAFHCNVDERKMRAMADAVVSTGLAKAGYEFINIDDCWQVMRSLNGSILSSASSPYYIEGCMEGCMRD